MKITVLLMSLVLLSACAAQDEAEQQSTQDITQAVRDFIDVRELQETDRMSNSRGDSWEQLDQRFLIYKGRRETHLVEFDRRCYELDDNHNIIADVRRDATIIRARFDTLRGCRIQRLYALTEGEVVELESLGEAVGSRN